MPTRLIREGILTSDAINALGWFEEVFYRRLMSVADDYGLYDARPVILRSALFPLKIDKVREADIERGLAACEEAGLVRFYSVDGKQYLQIVKFGQQAKSKPKWPLPPEESSNDPLQPVTNRNESLPSVTKTESETETNNTPSISLPCLPEEVEAYLRNTAMKGGVRLIPDQIPNCVTAYFAKRDFMGWMRGGIPVTKANWRSDAVNFAISYAENHPVPPHGNGDKDPYSNLEEL